MSDPEDHPSDLDDFDPSFGPDFDMNLDDANTDTLSRSSCTQAAWQRLDERNDDLWLKEQLADWDDWDDWADDAGLH